MKAAKKIKTKAKDKEQKPKRVRPTLYEIRVKPKLLVVQAWCRAGDTNETIAKKLGIDKSMIYRYQKKYPEFLEVMQEGKEEIDTQVENALLKRALGYEYEERIAETSHGKQVVRIIQKHMPGDVTAQIFWLKSRKPEEWANRKNQRLEVIGSMLDKLADAI